jgi:hypothetical protein
MLFVYVRCYAELNGYLPEGRRYTDVPMKLDGSMQVRELIRRIRIPEDEVDLILVNGRSADFSGDLHRGDRISLYPVFESFDISTVSCLPNRPLRHPRFVLDVHLGKLANHLRMFGFDTAYRNDYTDALLLQLSIDEGRTLLTKDRELLNHQKLTRAYFVREKDPRLQVIEIFRRFDLFSLTLPFTRCIECNDILRGVEKKDVLERLPLRVREVYDEFQICGRCDRVYWKGSHYGKMLEFVLGIMEERSTLQAG